MPDPFNPGAFRVMFGDTAQSWVDPGDPLRLEFEYVQRICEALDATVLTRPDGPDDPRLRVVHIGGAGMSIPRYVEARRPHTAQIVLEPDADLTDEVRRKMPLPRHSGIKVRAQEGRPGLVAMPAAYADAIILDAFVEASVPASLGTDEFLGEVERCMRAGGVFLANVTDKSPFGWAKRFVAGVRRHFHHVSVTAEPAVWKGRRFGNMVVVASDTVLPVDLLERQAARAAFPYRSLDGRELARWVGRSAPWSDADATASPPPARGRSWFS